MEPIKIENSNEITTRYLCTPSEYAKNNLLYIQEIGVLEALRPYESKRKNLFSFLFLLVEEGQGKLVCEQQEYEIKKGSCAFLDCMYFQSHQSSEKLWKLKWVHFYGNGLPETYKRYLENGGKNVFSPSDVTKFDLILDRIYRTASSDQGNALLRDVRINRELAELITEIVEEALRSAAKEKTRMQQRDVTEIRDYIDTHYRDQLSLDILSSTFYIDKYYLTRVFKKQFGISVNQYVSQVRIRRAKELLRFTDRPLDWISQECGFGNVGYFSRVFRRLENMTPSGYRRIWKSSSK